MKRKWEVTLILYFKSSIYFLRRKVISKKGIVLFSYFYYTSMTVDICDRHGHTYCLIWSSDQKDKQNNSAKNSYLSSTTSIILARIIWSWQCCKLLVDNIANGIAFKKIFTFLTELGNFKQNFFWRQCRWQCCQTKVCSIVKSRWFWPLPFPEVF